MNLRVGSCLLIAALALTLTGAVRAQEDEQPGLAGEVAGVSQAEVDYRTGRVSDVRGTLSVRGEEEDDVSEVERNAILREGDTLWTSEDGRAEIELERSAWVRLAEDTKLEIHGLPPSGEFRLWTGSVYFDVSEHIERAIRLKTPSGDVDVQPSSVVRVDLSRDDAARVSVYSGRAQVTPDRGEPIRVAAGERLYLEADRPSEVPAKFDRDDLDGFDKYHRSRVDYYVERPVPTELSEDVLGARDLNDYGSWVEVENTRYWRPRAEAGWRPYSTGYWSYVPSYGYSWIDYQPWGYTTSHYGRWLYRPVHGWLWYPGRVWAPSYVYWSSYGNYCGWAPLDPWNRPAFYGPGNFCSSLNLIVDYRSWTFCPQDRFYYGRHHRRFASHGRSFYNGHEVRINPARFRMVRNAHHEFGVPRERARGITQIGNGLSPRERVLRLEQRMPERRLRLIENRFRVPAARDRERALRPSNVERLQRDPAARIDPTRIVRGDEALRRVMVPRRRLENDRNAGQGPDRPGRTGVPGRVDAGTQQPGAVTPGRDGNGVRPGRNGIGDRPAGILGRRDVDRNDRPQSRPGSGTVPDRDRGFRRGQPRQDPGAGAGTPGGRDGMGQGPNVGGSPSGPVADPRNGAAVDREQRRGPRGGFERGNGTAPGQENPGRRDESRNGGLNPRLGGGTVFDRDFHRGQPGTVKPQPAPGDGGRREDAPRANDRAEAERREAQQRREVQERREAQQREAQERDGQRRDGQRQAEQRQAEQREAERRETERRQAQRQEAEQRETQRREAQQRDAQRESQQREAQRESQQREAQREAQQREAQRRDAEQREAQRKEAQQREAQQREAQQREAQQREAQQREAQQREAQQREAQQRESQQRRDNERRDNERRDNDRRDNERRDNERRDNDRRDNERRDNDRRDNERRRERGSFQSSPQFPPATVPAGGGFPADDRFRRGAGVDNGGRSSYRDFPAPPASAYGRREGAVRDNGHQLPAPSAGFYGGAVRNGGSYSGDGQSYGNRPSYSAPSPGGTASPAPSYNQGGGRAYSAPSGGYGSRAGGSGYGGYGSRSGGGGYSAPSGGGGYSAPSGGGSYGRPSGGYSAPSGGSGSGRSYSAPSGGGYSRGSGSSRSDRGGTTDSRSVPR